MMFILLILLLAVCVALIVCLLLIKKQNNEIAKVRCDLTDSCISAQQLLQGNKRLKTKLENVSTQSFYLCDALVRLAKDNDKILRDILRREDNDEVLWWYGDCPNQEEMEQEVAHNSAWEEE